MARPREGGTVLSGPVPVAAGRATTAAERPFAGAVVEVAAKVRRCNEPLRAMGGGAMEGTTGGPSMDCRLLLSGRDATLRVMSDGGAAAPAVVACVVPRCVRDAMTAHVSRFLRLKSGEGDAQHKKNCGREM